MATKTKSAALAKGTVSKATKRARVPMVSGATSAIKSKEEVDALRASALEVMASGGPSVACWFKDGGGTDFCVPVASAQSCTDQGGQTRGGNCPNAFSLLASHVIELKNQIDELRQIGKLKPPR
jgi:hypothetical protein